MLFLTHRASYGRNNFDITSLLRRPKLWLGKSIVSLSMGMNIWAPQRDSSSHHLLIDAGSQSLAPFTSSLVQRQLDPQALVRLNQLRISRKDLVSFVLSIIALIRLSSILWPDCLLV